MSGAPLKTCSRCGKDKPLEEFHPKTGERAGVHAYCKPCFNAYKRDRRATGAWKEREKTYNDRYNVEKLYNITLEEFNRLVEAAGGVCEICGGPPKGRSRLSVDHNHKTGKVRVFYAAPATQFWATLMTA